MEWKDECKEVHVREAIRLFKVSTFNAASSGIVAPEGIMSEEQRREADRVRAYINRRCPVKSKISETALLAELRKKFSDLAIIRTLQQMLYNGQFQYTNQRKALKRVSADLEDE